MLSNINKRVYEQIIPAVALLTAVMALYLSSFYSYLLFHSLIEIVTITIGFMLFTLTWNTRSYLENNYLKLLGIGYAFIALIDLTHLLAYKGINIFTGYGANLPTQLWIAARYLQAVTLCTAPFFLDKRLYNRYVFVVYTAAVSALIAMVFTGNFPDCFIDGKGLTPFKVMSEYLISAFMFLSLYFLYRKRSHFDKRVYSLTVYSIVFTALSELSFTTYISVYGFTNMLGHYFKLAAFYLIYRALLVTGIRDPFNLIFRELNATKEKLQHARNDLEVKIRERTSQLHEELAERRLAEERLKISGERMRLTMEAAQIGIFDWDVENDIWQASPEYYTMLGYQPEKGPDDRIQWLNRVHADDREAVDRCIKKILSREPSVERPLIYEYEARLRHADGTYRWEHVKGFGIKYNDKGQVMRVLGIRMDIHERKIAEEKLARERSLLRCLIDSVSDLIFIKDLKGAYQGCNKASEDFIGIPESEQIGKTDFDFFDREMAEEVQNADRQVIEKREPLRIEEWVTTRDGRLILMDTLKSPYYDTDGKALGIVGISRDITERKKTEEEIRKLNMELEQRVHDRTAELEASNKELESFAYSISHDLRSPLRHIDGFIALLKEESGYKLSKKSLHYMSIIANSAKMMGQLIDDLLTFSRMGRQAMSLKEIDLELIINSVLKELEKEYTGRKIRWDIGDLPAINGDPFLLRIVLMNLVSNALKFTRSREEAVIETGCKYGEGEIIFFVRDNGVGFEQEYVDKIFGVFQRLHRSDEFEGTGVGLAIVQRVIQRHGGRVWAEGEVDRGATFYFSLPKKL